MAAVTEPVCGQSHTLGNIPEGWKVKANGDSVPVVNGTATITYGATVVLTPTYPDRVKSVKLVDDSLLSGKFSVSATKQVQFSRGNLQATCSSADGNSSTQETWTWHFAEHQWDYIGNAAANNSINGNGSVSIAGTVDLFGWVGASSTWEGAAKYGISNSTTPNSASTYGDNKSENLKSDWGNTIGTGWRTLTREEWKYLMDHHTKGWSTVNGVNGYVIRPDGVSTAIAASYTASDWAAEEAAGSVFLPATGYREGTEVKNVGSHGNYWSSSPNTADVQFAYRLYFSDSNLDPQSSYWRFFGYPVRLVKDAPAPTTSCTGKTINLQYVSSDTVAKDCDTLTGTLAANVKISIADGATVTLRDATINGVHDWDYEWAGITCLGNATIILSGTNTVKGFSNEYPGIQAAHNYGEGGEYTLTIQGTGSLTASSNGKAAGIGAAKNENCGNITISGGTITATGGDQAAGIGGSNYGECGNITISGGTITASGGDDAAGIGSGADNVAACGNITISGGTITATGRYGGAGIGSGNNGASCGNITITSGETSVTATKGASATNSIGAGKNGTCGTVTFGTQQMYNGTTWTTTPTNGQTYGGLKFSIKTTTITDDTWELTCRRVDLSQITADSVMQDGDVLTGTLTANVKISIANGATVTLDNVTIKGTGSSSYKWAGITCLGDATIILKDGTTDTVRGFYENYPGIYVPENSTLTIQGGTSGTGKLIASSNGYGAGIGGWYYHNCGNINIQSGDIKATGGQKAAGIGGAGLGDFGTITISGGTINATGGDYAAGIGSGNNGSCGDIMITSGVTSVTATKGADAPNSIGAGLNGSCGTVTIGSATGAITDSPYTYPPQP